MPPTAFFASALGIDGAFLRNLNGIGSDQRLREYGTRNNRTAIMRGMRTVRLGALLATVLTSQMIAQQTTIIGSVRSTADSAPLRSVVVTLNNSATVLTDSSGQFRIAAADWGTNILAARRMGYEQLELIVWVTTDTILELGIMLEPLAVELEAITVTTDVIGPEHLVREGFYERRRLGFGRFMARDDIERRNPQFPSDLLMTVPMRYKTPCGLFVDGIRIDVSGGGVLKTINQILTPRTIEAMEVYSGGADAPVRFNVVGCRGSVLVVWTR